MRTLPFGAAASVLHFNRISKLLWALGCKLGLIWASYYDDYPLLCPSNLEASSLGGAKALFNLLGFEYAADKMFDPAPKADILGVELDLSLSGQGCVDIRNKQDRIEDICNALDNILETGRLKPRDLPSHLGRLQFADMQIAGRAGKLAMHDLRQMGSTGAAEIDLEPSHVSALKLLRKRIASGKPRRLEARPQTKPWILFTDGALEYTDDGKTSASIGVPEATLKVWQVEGRQHVIGIIELYACVVALVEWQHLLKNQRTLLFVDNYGAQDCLIRGSAGVNTWRQLLMILEDMDDELFANLWVTRVPSHSNPADFPSRGSIKELSYLGELRPCFPSCPIMKVELKNTC
eukprot:s2786_g10.t1